MLGTIIVGAIVGAIASKLMNADNGFLINILVGVLGAWVGHFLFGLIGFSAHGFAGLIVEIIGACVVIALARKIR